LDIAINYIARSASSEALDKAVKNPALVTVSNLALIAVVNNLALVAVVSNHLASFVGGSSKSFNSGIVI
jgi:hypothetical protein